jgi:hypothetical protein
MVDNKVLRGSIPEISLENPLEGKGGRATYMRFVKHAGSLRNTSWVTYKPATRLGGRSHLVPIEQGQIWRHKKLKKKKKKKD